jgi:hypothetical protein
VNIRLTAEMTGDRHGIFVGCAGCALISDNHLELFRQFNAGQDIFAIKVMGVFGQSFLIERNCMLNFTNGIVVIPEGSSSRGAPLWKAADNASTSANLTPNFVTDDVR